MKKLFLFIAITGIMISCKDKKDEKKVEEPTTIPPATTEPTTITTVTEPSTTSVNGVPTFSDPEVQKYVTDYTNFITSYVDAYKTKDMSKIQTFAIKVSDWTSRSMDVSKRLVAKPDEAAKFSAYMTKLSEELTAGMAIK